MSTQDTGRKDFLRGTRLEGKDKPVGIVFDPYLAARQVEGRMENIPEEIYEGKPEIKSRMIQAEIKPEIKSPIYYSHKGFICACGYYMVDEPVNAQQNTVKVWCSNQFCSEHMIDKVVKLPSVDYSSPTT